MKNNKFKGVAFSNKKPEVEKLHNDKHFASVVSVFTEASFVSGKFCDVKIVCMVRNQLIQEVLQLNAHFQQCRTPTCGLTESSSALCLRSCRSCW